MTELPSAEAANVVGDDDGTSCGGPRVIARLTPGTRYAIPGRAYSDGRRRARPRARLRRQRRRVGRGRVVARASSNRTGAFDLDPGHHPRTAMPPPAQRCRDGRSRTPTTTRTSPSPSAAAAAAAAEVAAPSRDAGLARRMRGPARRRHARRRARTPSASAARRGRRPQRRVFGKSARRSRRTSAATSTRPPHFGADAARALLVALAGDAVPPSSTDTTRPSQCVSAMPTSPCVIQSGRPRGGRVAPPVGRGRGRRSPRR